MGKTRRHNSYWDDDVNHLHPKKKKNKPQRWERGADKREIPELNDTEIDDGTKKRKIRDFDF
ncbi:MAG: hypothetical protein WD512_14350 [Candidatus Paceibacterota bacterium]